jgi:hypothetical protein
MNKHKQIFAALIVGVFAIPQIALAAWWNPLSWFGETEIEPTVQYDSAIKKDNGNDTSVDEAQIKISDERTIPNEVVENVPVTKNVASNKNYDDEISKLRQEIQTMKTNMDSLKKTNDTLLAALNNQSGSGVISEQKLIGRVEGLEKRADGDQRLFNGINSRLSKIESQPKTQNYDYQIKEMARYINALLHDQTKSCTYGPQSDKDGLNGILLCNDLFKDLSF